MALDSEGKRVDAVISFVLLGQVFKSQLVIQWRTKSIRNNLNADTKRMLRIEVVA